MKFVSGMVVAAVAAMIATTAAAQGYPSRAVRVIVPSTPGDGADLLARAMGAKLQESLGQPFIVENRPGAGGVLGSEQAARAAPDGYTLIVGHAGSHAINAALYAKLPYDPQRDFAPVMLFMTAANVLIVNPQLPVRTVAEFVDYVKARPDQLGYASGGNGSSAHLNMEAFKAATGIAINHVPYKGSTPALTDIMSGVVPGMFVNLPPALPHIRSGKVRALAVTTLERTPTAPDVPTVHASGVPGFESLAWFGMLAPAGTPADIVAKLNGEANRVAATEEWRSRIRGLGGDVVTGGPEVFAKRIAADVDKWKKVVAQAGIKAE